VFEMFILINKHYGYYVMMYTWQINLTKYINMYLLGYLFYYHYELLDKFLESMYHSCEFKYKHN